MRVVSLFDGMSCGQVALQRAGRRVDMYLASEIDKYAIKVAQKNFPQTIQLGDVVIVRQMAEAGVFGHVDLLIGGSPCQGFSFAGKQLAFDDPRSVLFFEYVRILQALRRWNPNIRFMLENVRMKKEFLAVITSLLGVQPICINSALVSAQNRVRYYWCNWKVEQPADRGILLRDILETGEVEREKSMTIRPGGLTSPHDCRQNWATVVRDFKELSPAEMDYMNRTVNDGRNPNDFAHHADSDESKSPALVANLHKGVPYNVLIDRRKPNKLANSHPSGRGMNGWIYDPDAKAPTLTTNKGEGSKVALEPSPRGAALRGRPDKNGVNVQQTEIRHDAKSNALTLRHKDSFLATLEVRADEKANSVNATGHQSRLVTDPFLKRIGHGFFKGSDKPVEKMPPMTSSGWENNNFISDKGITYRKLTVTECERLQGLTDNYTDGGVSNSQRYKMLGNGWQVDTIEHIFRAMPHD